MSVDDYFEYDGTRDIRYEYVGGYLYAMVGASRRHNLIVANIGGILWQATRGSECQAFSSAMRVKIAGDAYYYPDVVVTCDPEDTDTYMLVRPCLVVEVLSHTTRERDQREKLLSYRQIPSLGAYLVVHQEEMWIERHWRDHNGGWQRSDVIGLESSVPLPCPELDLALADIYANLPDPAPS
jgi:Uma2 family endonuclease